MRSRHRNLLCSYLHLMPALASAPSAPRRLSRRRFLQISCGAAAGALGCAGYGRWETQQCEVVTQTIVLPRLPARFDGLRLAFLADTHHGPSVPLDYLRRVIAQTNALAPDLVALGGDYVQRKWDDYERGLTKHFVRPGIEIFGALRARLGVFAVLGNHDTWEGHVAEIKAALADSGVRELTDTGVWLEATPGSASDATEGRLRLCGVNDLKTTKPGPAQLAAALGDATAADAVVLLQHNPDYAETLRDERVGLVLSGHTHGGQIVLPWLGAPIVPSAYGQKYRAGLVRAPQTQVFVTRGVGTVFPPLRFRCPPEIALLILRRGSDGAATS